MSFSKPKMLPPPPPPVTGETMEMAASARSRLRRRVAGLFGRQSTMLTGGSGSGAPKPAESRTLLGG